MSPSYHKPYSPRDWRRNSAERPMNRVRARRRGMLLRRIVWWGVLISAIGILIGGLTLAVLLAWASRDLPDPSKLITRTVPQSTKILDRTGEHLLFEFHGAEKRTQRTLDQIAPTVKWATIAIEDKNFYAHKGFRLRSLIRAIIFDVLRGGRSQGGSTITQQLIKNAILSPEKTIRRKIKELLLAERLEQKFTKDEILTMYLNEIPYGSTAYGIESAAQMFFGETAATLDLAESAMLSALPQSTTRLSPYGSHRDELIARTQLILGLMAEQGYITKDEAEAAKKVDVIARVKPRREPITAPHFVMYVRELLTDRYGERAIEEGGLKVITTLDFDRQKDAEDAITKYADRNAKQYDATNAALVAIDVPTGQVIAMVGSKDYFDETIDGQVNVAVRPRQPGSSFKPIVYAAAFAAGYTPETLLEDVATSFPTSVGAYEPANYDGKERGLVTIRKALAGSLNIPAVKTLYLAGIDRVLDLADRLGYTTLKDRSRFGLALVLGGGEVKLIEHTALFAALAAEGTRRATSVIVRVEDPSGRALEEWQPPTDERIIDPEVVRQLTSILTDNEARTYVFGANSPLAFKDRAVAAKTGTTNDWHDAWTMGYTPSLAVGVWVGNSDNHAMKKKSDGSYVAAPIWRAFLDAALKGKPAEAFTPPQPTTADKPVLRGEEPLSTRIRVDRTTGQPATDTTPVDQVEERTQQDLHTILKYVRRDDPRGPAPEKPEDDPMYKPWEDALQAWAQRNHIVTGPPTTINEADRPVLDLTSPQQNATISGRSFDIAGTSRAVRGSMSRIDVRIDGISAALIIPQSESLQSTVRLPAIIGRGQHELLVTAYDTTGGSRSVTITVDVQSDRELVALTWEQPVMATTIRGGDFPYTLSVTATNAAGATRVEIWTQDAGGNHLLTNVVPPADGSIRILWPRPPAIGTTTLRAKLFVKDQLIIESEPREVHIAK